MKHRIEQETLSSEAKFVIFCWTKQEKYLLRCSIICQIPAKTFLNFYFILVQAFYLTIARILCDYNLIYLPTQIQLKSTYIFCNYYILQNHYRLRCFNTFTLGGAWIKPFPRKPYLWSVIIPLYKINIAFLAKLITLS